jgi:tRNA nucleotidyltransferase/poly(A) polymerase
MNTTTIKTFIKKMPRDLLDIIEKLEYYGFDARIVGGAVRDLLLDEMPRDIDMGTDATPDEIIFILNNMYDEYNFQLIDTGGIEHGTVKVITEIGNLYEITSLAFKIKERQSTIKITQHRDWKLDAYRRDFTINAMSISMNGIVYDYLNGLYDLVNQQIKFIGFYKNRILLEPLLVLRFAKLLTKFSEPKYNISIIKFIGIHRDYILERIKPTTLQWYMEEIKTNPYPQSATPILLALKLPPLM